MAGRGRGRGRGRGYATFATQAPFVLFPEVIIFISVHSSLHSLFSVPNPIVMAMLDSILHMSMYKMIGLISPLNDPSLTWKG